MFKDLLFDLKEISENNNFKIKTFPIRNDFMLIKKSIHRLLQDVKLDMISIDNQDKNLDIYQSYFEDYKIKKGTLTVNFKYNKERQIKLF